MINNTPRLSEWTLLVGEEKCKDTIIYHIGWSVPSFCILAFVFHLSSSGSNGGSIESGGSWCGGGGEVGGVGEAWEDPEVYLQMSSRTRTLVRFVKVAYPDLVGARGPAHLEQLYEKDRRVCRFDIERRNCCELIVNVRAISSFETFSLYWWRLYYSILPCTV